MKPLESLFRVFHEKHGWEFIEVSIIYLDNNRVRHEVGSVTFVLLEMPNIYTIGGTGRTTFSAYFSLEENDIVNICSNYLEKKGYVVIKKDMYT